MEVNFDLHKYITAFDNVIPKKTLETLKKICINHKDFESATVIGGGEPVLNENIRRVKTWGLNNIGTNSLTEVLWCNYLLKHLKTLKSYEKYNKLKKKVFFFLKKKQTLSRKK